MDPNIAHPPVKSRSNSDGLLRKKVPAIPCQYLVSLNFLIYLSILLLIITMAVKELLFSVFFVCLDVCAQHYAKIIAKISLKQSTNNKNRQRLFTILLESSCFYFFLRRHYHLSKITSAVQFFFLMSYVRLC